MNEMLEESPYEEKNEESKQQRYFIDTSPDNEDDEGEVNQGSNQKSIHKDTEIYKEQLLEIAC